MKFNLTLSEWLFVNEEVKRLEQLGFSFTDGSSRFFNIGKGIFTLDSAFSVEIEFNTLEELIEFSKKWGWLEIEDGEIRISGKQI